MLKDYFSLAFRNLKKRGLRSWLTMLGIFIGIAAVVALISLGQGLQSAVIGQFADLSVDTLTIQNANTGFGPPGSTAIKKLDDNDLDIIESVQGVEIAVPRLVRVVSLEYNDAKSFTYVGDLHEEKERLDFIYKSLNLDVEKGQLLESNDHGKVVLGNDFISDKVFGKEIKIGSSILIQGEKFEVSGILKKASTFTINSVVMMLNDDMEDLLDIDDEFDIIIARVEDKDEMVDVAKNIEDKFRNDRDLKVGEEDFSVQTPLQSLEGVNNILLIVNLIVVGIALISLLVGGIGITNTMYTSVLERTKEIGIMKAIGAKNSDVLMIFLIESGLLGLVGGIVGAIIGLSMAWGVSGAASAALGDIGLKVSLNYPLLLSAVSFSFFIGIASGVMPAMQASKLKPVDALRGTV
jgi:putative ABC transport system permease protein